MFLFEKSEQSNFFSENFDVCLFITKVVARAFELNVASTVFDSKSCGSDSHCRPWLIAFLCSVFVVVLHNQNV